MKCKICNSEVNETEKECPVCGESLNQETVEIVSLADNKEISEKNITDSQIERVGTIEKHITNGKKRVKCTIKGYETEINEDEDSFYCEKCDDDHIIDNKRFIVLENNIDENKENTVTQSQDNEEALYLILKNNENEIIKIPNSKESRTIGRKGDYGSDLFTRYGMKIISRKHIKIDCVNGDYVLYDLNSTNGTELIRDKETTKLEKDSPIILKNNDEIILAKSISFRVEIK